MDIAGWLSKASLSSRQKRVDELVDKQLRIGKSLAGRIEALRGREQAEIPRDDWVSNAELTGWYHNCRELVQDLCGDQREPLHRWDDIWTREPPSSPYDDDAVDIHINRIRQARDFLDGIRNDPALSRNRAERIVDRTRRHRIAGPLIAIAVVLGGLIGFIKAVFWLVGLVD